MSGTPNEFVYKPAGKAEPEAGPAPAPEAAPEAAPKPQPPRDPPPAAANDPISYTNRFAGQHYHPVILIGSSSAGKTVLLLSLLAYFKSGSNPSRLGIVFGDDLFKATERNLKDVSKRYFDQLVAEYIRGRAAGVTRIETPMFIPATVFGDSRPDLKFAFMESDGEKYQPSEKQGEDFFPAFDPKLVSLLTQYPDGVSFIWVVPHVPATVPRVLSDPNFRYDKNLLIQRAQESLEGAFKNYTTLRGGNSARDTHLLLVTKWDTYESKALSNDIRIKLDRANDDTIMHEVDGYLSETYGGVYGTFESLKSPIANKVAFRYSAGAFEEQDKAHTDIDELLRTYPRDVWNWLYDGMRKGHDWELEPGPLLPKPAPKRRSLIEIWRSLVSRIIG